MTSHAWGPEMRLSCLSHFLTVQKKRGVRLKRWNTGTIITGRVS